MSKKQSYKGREYNNSSSGSSVENYTTPAHEEEELEEDYIDCHEDLDLAALRKPGTVYWDPNSPSDSSSQYQARLTSREGGSRRRFEQTSPSILLGSKERAKPPTIPLQTTRSRTPNKFTRTGSMEELKSTFKIYDKNQSYSPIKEESKQPKTTTTTTAVTNNTTTSISISASTGTNDDNKSSSVPDVKSNPSINTEPSAVSTTSSNSNVFGEFPDDDDDFDDELLAQSTQAVELAYLNSSKQASSSSSAASSSGAETYRSAISSSSSRVSSENTDTGTMLKDQGSSFTSPLTNDSNNNSNNTSLFEKSTCDDPIQSTPSRPKYPRLDSNERNSIRNNTSDNNATPVKLNTVKSDPICVGEMMEDDDDAFLGSLEY